MELCAGVIGCGGISRFHFPALARAQVRVKWACDVNEEAAAAWAGRCGGQATADWQRVLADREVNVVDITAPSRLHKSICLAAIAAGKAVICEKTLAETADDALEIVRAAARKNIRAGVQGSQPATTGYDVDELIATIQKSSASGQAMDVRYRA